MRWTAPQISRPLLNPLARDRLPIPLEPPTARKIAQSDQRQRILRSSKAIAATLGLVHAAFLSGCAVGPDFAAPDLPAAGYGAAKIPAATQSAPVAGGAAQHLVEGRDVPGEWWGLFRSKQVSALVDEAIRNHPDIMAAEAALRQARETAVADVGLFLPQASSNASVTRQQTSAAQFGGSTVPAQLYTLYNTNVSVSFTPDVFGKTMRTVEADLSVAERQRFQLEATYLALTANVVATAIADASYAAQIRVTRELIASYQTELDLLDKRFELGAVSQADVLSQRALLAQAQGMLPPLEKTRAQTRNQLMAYLGRFPDADKGEAIDLESLRLPRKLPLSLPSSLVRQRPDIRSAESQMHEASARIGVATANMLPQITLSATAGSQALSLDKLFGPQTGAWSLGAALAGQVFDGGTLFHRREAALAAFEQSTAKYRSTVITAFQNVADALQAIKHDAASLRAQALAETAAAQSLEIARIQFNAGSTTYTHYFGLGGRSYKVIPQIAQRFRLNADHILNYYIKTADGASVPLSTVAKIETSVAPESLNHFQQANAATISGVSAPGVIAGDALKTLKDIADRVLPQGYSIDYAGPSRQFVQESSGFAVTFGFALIIIFLALAAQFESYRDPLIILVSVPMSIAGALVFIMLGFGGASINIYTQVGLVTLMGLISKHGILIVEFANELQHAGMSKREAILEATSIRLRPILMTTAAMVLGVFPLIMATGAGAASRFNMGLVIASGLSIGTLFTLFVLPAVYLVLAADHSAKAEAGAAEHSAPVHAS